MNNIKANSSPLPFAPDFTKSYAIKNLKRSWEGLFIVDDGDDVYLCRMVNNKIRYSYGFDEQLDETICAHATIQYVPEITN